MDKPPENSYPINATQSGSFLIGGKLAVNRLGFGTMHLTGQGVWGQPANRDEAIAVLRKAVSLGINFIDTADSYGPYVAEEIIYEALHPYPSNLVIASKAGLVRPGPDQWDVDSSPQHLRSACEGSLKRLGLERIELFQLHRIDPKYSLEDQIGTLVDLQQEGKIHFIGLSEATVEQIEQASKLTQIVTVQNKYNLLEREYEQVLKFCTQKNIGFIPWFPLATGELAKPGSILATIADQLKVTPSQVALAWLLKKSPIMLPIPGTSSVRHLEENVSAVKLELSDKHFNELENLQNTKNQ
jgi:pyridoxine 4-dehydrogenase